MPCTLFLCCGAPAAFTPDIVLVREMSFRDIIMVRMVVKKSLLRRDRERENGK